jgi:hypothetical protein
VKGVAGDMVDFPKPHVPVKVPPKKDHTSQVTVPLYLFNTVFGVLQTNGALDLDITPELVSVALGELGWELPAWALGSATWSLISLAEPFSL